MVKYFYIPYLRLRLWIYTTETEAYGWEAIHHAPAPAREGTTPPQAHFNSVLYKSISLSPLRSFVLIGLHIDVSCESE